MTVTGWVQIALVLTLVFVAAVLQGRRTLLSPLLNPADATKPAAAPYNAAGSGGSNLGPTSKALLDRVTASVAALGHAPVPGDSVTTSASGLDPDIPSAFAALQVPRIAAARYLAPDQVQAIIARHTAGRVLGVIGEPPVNVLAVNLDLGR